LIGQQNRAIFVKKQRAFAYLVVIILKKKKIVLDSVGAVEWLILVVL
jgi:hypothetical protein